MSCFSPYILDFFYNIQNTGRIIKPEAIGKAGSKAEGTVIEFSWRVEDGVIKDARFRTFGDVNAIAISSLITSMVVGKDVEEVLYIKPEDIIEHLKDNKPNYLYFIHLGLEAIANAYENYNKKSKPVARKENKFATSLRENLTKVEAGELLDDSSYNLADISENEEEDYLQNLNAYQTHKEEISSIEGLFESSSVDVKPNGYLNSVGRGRPRKERTEEELELLNRPKLSRGRPRKERTPEELEALANKPNRGRGRPKKERTPEELEAELNKVSRGRGRPRKERTEEELLALANKPNRGRGRPKKERTPEELEALANKPVRGRGRPRKTDGNDNKFSYKPVFSYMNNISSYTNDLSNNSYVEEDEEQEDIQQVSSVQEVETKPEVVDVYSENYNMVEEPSYSYNEIDYSQEKRGRGRPRKERTEEELLALANKPNRGRGRPKKERTEEELEALANKPIRGRGRPKKERTHEELEDELNKVSRGRGRPKKILQETDIIEKSYNSNNEEKRGRGRPKKYTAIVIQNVKQQEKENFEEVKTEENNLEENNFASIQEEVKPSYEATIENEQTSEEETKTEQQESFNSFAPAQNKYGVGLSSLNNVYKTKKVTIRHEEITNSTVTKAE